MGDRCNDSDPRRVRPVPSRREALKLGAALVVAPFREGVASVVEAAEAAVAVGSGGAATGWSSYAGDKASSKYSPLAQIGADNFERLKVAWTWRSAEEEVAKANPDMRTWAWESTPLMVDGVLYVSTSLSQVAASTPQRARRSGSTTRRRGRTERRPTTASCIAASPTGRMGDDRRILFGTGRRLPDLPGRPDGQAHLRLRRAGAHRPDAGPGSHRRPASLRRLVAAHHLPRRRRDGLEGSRRPGREGDAARGRAGLRRPHRQAALASSTPFPERASSATRPGSRAPGSTTGGANVWTLMSADEELGYVYLPVQHAHQRLLRRPAARRRPVRREPRLPGRAHRASASGTSRWSTTASGTTTSPRRPT